VPRASHVPSYRLHEPSGRAVVTVRTPNGSRRDIYLGEYNSPDSRKEYARILAELATAPVGSNTLTPAGPAGADITVDELMLAFLRWALTHYRTPDGEPTTEVDEIKRSLGPVRRLYGHTPAADFGPKALAAVRQHMIGLGWCRTLINRRVERIKRMFRWAASEELVPVAVYQGLRTLPGLQKGRTEARESEPVRPVDPTHVAAVLPHLNRIEAAGSDVFVPTRELNKILAALDGRGLTLQELASETRMDSHTVLKHMRPMRGRLIFNKKGVGYYRADAPPRLPAKRAG
jgi:hypothetical protein